ncbi:inositol monophosphatase 3-like [Amphiura filiformis]|uniref:inositol monophosphatase 3-like n=1 Tax=Amphiura filiformis TaxID=82378 RepID=UPI003B224DD8
MNNQIMSNIKVSPVGFIVIFLLVGALVLYFERTWSDSGNNESEAVKRGQTISLRDILSASIELAERGGEQVKEVMKEKKLNEQSKGKTKEGVNNPVTDGDMRSHEAIMHGFQVTFPETLLVVSEEHEEKDWDRSKVKPADLKRPDVNEVIQKDERVPIEDVTIWIDPLDATKEYTEELLHYVTVMVCVAVNGKPTIGVIHKPFAKEDEGDSSMSWAWVGKGHSTNLNTPVKKATAETDPKIIVSRSHAGSVKEVAQQSFGKDTEVIPAGGAGFKTLALFQGKADAYIHTTLIKKWDICAGNALLHEFSGTMTTLKGDIINYDGHGSPDHNPKNEGGLLATLWDAEIYRGKLAAVLNEGHHR